ncbi:MAG: hypothetical protein WCC52_00160 [Nitrosotalea sp.]
MTYRVTISLFNICLAEQSSQLLYKVTVFFHADYIEVKDDKMETGMMSRPQRGKTKNLLRIKYNEVKTALFL